MKDFAHKINNVIILKVVESLIGILSFVADSLRSEIYHPEKIDLVDEPLKKRGANGL